MRRAISPKSVLKLFSGAFLSFIFTLGLPTSAAASNADPANVDPGATMIILDASGSMWGKINGQIKFDQARRVIENYLTTKDPAQDVGLTVYGHRREKDCNDIELVIPPGENSEWIIQDKLRNLKPLGKTPLTASVLQAARDLGYQQRKTNIILVTDGIETCGLDPCQAAISLENSGVDFTAHVIGFDIDARQRRTLDCLAKNTGGTYTDAKNAIELENAFDRIEGELRRENSDLRSQLDELRLRYAQALLDIDALRAEIAALRDELARVKRERDGFRREVEQLRQANGKLEARLRSLEQLLAARDREVQKLASDLDREREYAKELERSKNQTITGLEDALNRSRADAAKRLNAMNVELNTLKDEIALLKQAHDNEKNGLKAALANSNAALNTAKNTNAKLNKELDDFAIANRELADEIARQDEIIARLRNGKGLSDDQREDLQRQLTDLSVALKESQALADDLTREIAKLAADNQTKAGDINNLNDEIARLKAQRAAEANAARESLNNEANRIAALKDQLALMKDKLNNKSNEADNLAARLKAAEDQRNALSQDVNALDQDNREKDLEIARLQAKLADQITAREALQAQLDGNTGLFDQTQAQFGKALDDASREIARLNKRLADENAAKTALQSNLAATEKDVSNRDREIEELKRRLAEQTEKAAQAEEEAEATKEALIDTRQNAQLKEAAMDQDAKQRERDIAKLNSDLDNSRKELDKLQGLMDETNALMAAALAAFEKQRQELEAKLDGMRGRNEVLVKEVAGLTAISDERLRKEALRRTQFDEVEWILPNGFPEIDLSDMAWSVTSLGQSASYKTRGTGTKLRLPQTPGVFRIDVSKDQYAQSFEVEVDALEISKHKLALNPALMLISVEPAMVASDAALIVTDANDRSNLVRYSDFDVSNTILASAGSYDLKGLVTNTRTSLSVDLSDGQIQPVLLDFPVGVVQLVVTGEDTVGTSAAVVRWQLRRQQNAGENSAVNGAPINGSGANARIAVAEGTYRLLVTAGDTSRTQTIEVTRGGTSTANFEISSSNLEMAISLPSILKSDANKLSWSLDDTQGKIIHSGAASREMLNVKPGNYDLVVNIDGIQVRRGVTVDAQGKTSVDVDLQLGRARITPLNPDSATLFASPVRWILTSQSEDGSDDQRRRLSSTNDMLNIVLKPGNYRLNGLSGQRSGFAEFVVTAGQESEISVVFE